MTAENFQTVIFTLGYVRVILDLPNLDHLEHGSMFCDVLDYCYEQNLLQCPSPIKIKVLLYFSSIKFSKRFLAIIYLGILFIRGVLFSHRGTGLKIQFV